MQKNFLILSCIFLVAELYVYQAFKTITANPNARIAYWVVTLFVYAFLFYELLGFRTSERSHLRINMIATVFLAFLLPKIFALVFLVIDDILRLAGFVFNKFGNDAAAAYPGRRKFLSILGLGATGLIAAAFLDGVIFGKYRHRARQVKIKIAGLPKAFKGYKIVQISDVHSGSFRHPNRLKPAIELINKQNADLVLFTGDMVNNYADEFAPFVGLFANIKAKDGKLSVLGNHDYGMYGDWKNAAERENNVPKLEALQKQAGFTLLKNEHRIIEKNGEKLYIIGVENWGAKPFPQFGDLNAAVNGIPADAAKILMSHDPTHFDFVVKDHPANVQLTLSGHTHGMQFGVDLKNWRWSPVQFRYKKWADLYKSGEKYLYVNRGFGVIGYPGRVGILPEITVIELV